MNAAKRAEMLEAAKAEILSTGFEAAAIATIAAQAGVSKATLYRHFTDKTGLLVAIVEVEADRLQDRIQSLAQEKGSLPERLVAFGMALDDLIGAKDHRALESVVEREMPRHPELAEKFFASGPARLKSTLTGMLVQAVVTGDLDVPDPDSAAEHLIALLLGFDAVRRRFLPTVAGHKADRAQRMAKAVDLFLRAYAYRDAAEDRCCCG